MFSIVYRLVAVVAVLCGATKLHAAVSIERSVGSALVTQISRSSAADLVLLDAGHEAGFRQGMVCVATRDGLKVGELLLVDLRLRAASALILDLEPGRGLQPGDLVAVKTVSSRK
jgi:hypothetical protein